MSNDSFLDCCQDPSLARVKTLYETVHDAEALMRCASCSTFWFYRFSEWVNWNGGRDDLTSWYTQLTAAEGEALAAGQELDLAFLRDRPSWMDDNGTITRVPGTPGHPRS